MTRRPASLMISATVIAISTGAAGAVAAQSDTAFTYQGKLQQSGSPAEGAFNIDFSLWDAAVAGAQIGNWIEIDGVPVQDGVFTVQLDFGASAFDHADRWLEIEVDGATLSPRQPITRAPYALQTRGLFVADNLRVGINQPNPGATLHVTDPNTSVAWIRISEGTTGAYTGLRDYDYSASLEHYSNGGGIVEINPLSGSGVSQAHIQLFRRTSTTGHREVRFYRGNGDLETSAVIAVDGRDSYFQADGGNLGIGTDAPEAVLDVVGDSKFRNRLGVGNPGSLFGQLTVTDSGDGSIFAIEANSTNDTFPTIFASNTGTGAALWAQGTSEATPAGGGLIVAGAEAGFSVAIDDDEIAARNGGFPAPLHVNPDGGRINMGPNHIHPAFAYGVVSEGGTFISGSANITSIVYAGEGEYIIYFDEPLDNTDVMLATCNGLHGAGTLLFDGGMKVGVVSLTSGDLTNAQFSFVIYRP